MKKALFALFLLVLVSPAAMFGQDEHHQHSFIGLGATLEDSGGDFGFRQSNVAPTLEAEWFPNQRFSLFGNARDAQNEKSFGEAEETSYSAGVRVRFGYERRNFICGSASQVNASWREQTIASYRLGFGHYFDFGRLVLEYQTPTSDQYEVQAITLGYRTNLRQFDPEEYGLYISLFSSATYGWHDFPGTNESLTGFIGRFGLALGFAW